MVNSVQVQYNVGLTEVKTIQSAIGTWLFVAKYIDSSSKNSAHCAFTISSSDFCKQTTSVNYLKVWNTSAPSYIKIGNDQFSNCKTAAAYRDVRIYLNTVLSLTDLIKISKEMLIFFSPTCARWKDPFTCLTCNSSFYMNPPSCSPCSQSCAECSGPTRFECTVCAATSVYYENICTAECPTSYTLSSSTCQKTAGNLLHYKFIDLNQNVKDEEGRCSGSKGLDPEAEDSRDPKYAFQRGLYFDGNDILPILVRTGDQALILPISFTLEAWLRPQTLASTIFSGWNASGSDFFSSSTILSFKQSPHLSLWLYNKTQLTSTFTLTQGDWHYVVAAVSHSALLHRLCLLSDSTQECGDLDVSEYQEFTSNNKFALGFTPLSASTFGDFYQGFMYKFRILNYYHDPSDLKNSSTQIVTATLTPDGSIVSTCNFNQFISIDSSCEPCKTDCSEGCYDDNTCGACETSLCDSCRDFLASCSDCRTNRCALCIDANGFDANGTCTCKPNYYASSDLFLGCKTCPNDCLTCSSPTQCESCTNSAKVIVNGQCVCEDGYYNFGSSCFPCNRNCRTCASDINCLTCIETMSFVVGGKCVCRQGFYDSNASDVVSCSPCEENCKQCTSSSQCEECFDANAELVEGVCACKTGFESLTRSPLSCLAYGQETDISGGISVACRSDCSTCSRADSCETCKTNSYLLEDRCVCLANFFDANSSEGIDCQPCASSCISCTSGEADGCLICSDPNSFLENDICTCNKGYTSSNNICVPDCSSKAGQLIHAECNVDGKSTSQAQSTTNFAQAGVITSFGIVTVGCLMVGSPDLFVSLFMTIELLSFLPLIDLDLDEDTTNLIVGSNLLSKLPEIIKDFECVKAKPRKSSYNFECTNILKTSQKEMFAFFVTGLIEILTAILRRKNQLLEIRLNAKTLGQRIIQMFAFRSLIKCLVFLCSFEYAPQLILSLSLAASMMSYILYFVFTNFKLALHSEHPLLKQSAYSKAYYGISVVSMICYSIGIVLFENPILQLCITSSISSLVSSM